MCFNSHRLSLMPRFSIPTTDPAIPKKLAHNSWHTSVETYSWHGYAKWSPSPEDKKSNHACWKADSLSPLAQSCKILVSCQASITNWDSLPVSWAWKLTTFQTDLWSFDVHPRTVGQNPVNQLMQNFVELQETSYPTLEEGVVLLEIKEKPNW